MAGKTIRACPKPVNLLNYVSIVICLVTGRVMFLTETTKSSVMIDPDMLDTVGKFRYTDRLSGTMIQQSVHPVVTESEFLTLLPDLARPGHLMVRMEARGEEREESGGESGPPRRADVEVDALSHRHGEVRRRAHA
ncbi:carotenoid cleavage dioxygenase 8 homolog A, chloroplastic-like [Phragmites australis]|uniref:carotenoid cleavage dioxygenase 8 homolog A, chloroplastic-like n=1 Tax=Phragmites australis TaxID=29695 RepID=UPI002D784C11|nr:carotenoid cleavage dioxygenase 8 homolog A, chloroplastic-like [Phragmites australis]